MSFIKRNSDYIFTFITEFFVLLAGVLVYKFAANLEGLNDFSEYAICRRTISFILPLLIMGLGVGIPRYVAFSHDNTKKQSTYFFAGILIALMIALPILLIINLFKQKMAFLFFGEATFDYLIPSLSLMVVGMLLHGLNYGYFRGRIMMHHANVFQILNLAVAPLVVFAFFDNVLDIIFYTGLLWVMISVLFTFFIMFTNKFYLQNLKQNIKELLIYGVQRVPGDFVLAGFLALPAYFTAHMVNDNLVTAGYVAFSMSLLNMAGAAFGPICLILLPKASVIIKNKEFNLLKNQINKLTKWTLGLTIIGVLVLELFANQIIEIYLGNESKELIYCIRITFIASFGYTIYISLRSILDAYYVKAVNTINIVISFVLFVIMQAISYYFITTNYVSILYCFVIAMIVLGVLTYYETKKIIIKHNLV